MTSISWEWKLWLVNGLCQGYFFVFTSLTLIIGFNTTLPFLLEDDHQSLLRLKALAILVCFNICVNYFCLRYTAVYSSYKSLKRKDAGINLKSDRLLFNDASNTNNNSLDAQSFQDEADFQARGNSTTADTTIGGWTYCKDCDDVSPPRSKHCPLCDACILKRDHHCFFAGCCVGFHNQRYFAIFCLYGAIGGAFSSLITHFYLWHHYEGGQTWGVVAYFPPPLLWFWVTGNAPGFVVLMTLFLYWNCLTGFICFYYFCLQVLFIFRGQTKFECLKGIRSYRGNILLNLRSVFGNLWFIGFLVPGPFLRYHGDGVNWDEFMSIKSA